MRRKVFSIWSVLLVLVVSIAVLVPSCGGGGGEQGTIEVKATLDGSTWSGSVQYTLTGPGTINGTSVPQTFTEAPGAWTCSYISGGPPGAYFVDITPSPTQTLLSGGNITFTLDFRTQGTIEVKATLDGSPWPSSGTGAVNYTLTPVSGSAISGTEVPETFSVDVGSWTCAYVSGGPGTFVDITPSPTQSVSAGGTITFTLNLELEQEAAAAVADVESRATALIERSGCPLSFEGASFVTTVTEVNRDSIIEDIVNTTATVMASDFVCTGIKTLQEGLDEGLLTISDVEEYRTFVDSLVEVNDFVVAVGWLRTTDNVPLTTNAMVDNVGCKLIYDPMISSWCDPGPPAGSPVPPALTLLSVNQTRTWRPYPNGATVAERLFGDDAVSKVPVLSIFCDEKGNVVSVVADPQVSTFLAKAKVSQKTQVVGNCVIWSFRVHWGGPLVKIGIKAGMHGFDFDVEIGGIGCSGTDLEVYQLCCDGSHAQIEGPG